MSVAFVAKITQNLGKLEDQRTPVCRVNSNPSSNEFDVFLAVLGSDRESAGLRYETLRRRLIRLFEWRGAPDPEDLTDIVFERVAAKIAAGETIENPEAYSATVAQFVYRESVRRDARHDQIDREFDVETEGSDIADDDRRERCLRRCLGELPAADREFIVAYFDSDEKTMIGARKRLAEKLGSSMNTIRIRACRVKSKLESCVLKCCGR